MLLVLPLAAGADPRVSGGRLPRGMSPRAAGMEGRFVEGEEGFPSRLPPSRLIHPMPVAALYL